ADCDVQDQAGELGLVLTLVHRSAPFVGTDCRRVGTEAAALVNHSGSHRSGLSTCFPSTISSTSRSRSFPRRFTPRTIPFASTRTFPYPDRLKAWTVSLKPFGAKAFGQSNWCRARIFLARGWYSSGFKKYAGSTSRRTTANLSVPQRCCTL